MSEWICISCCRIKIITVTDVHIQYSRHTSFTDAASNSLNGM